MNITMMLAGGVGTRVGMDIPNLSIISGKDECSAHFDKFILKSELKFITLNQHFEKPLLP